MVEHISDRIRKPFFTPGTYALLAVMAIGFSFGLTRILGGLGAVTNLDNFYLQNHNNSGNIPVAYQEHSY